MKEKVLVFSYKYDIMHGMLMSLIKMINHHIWKITRCVGVYKCFGSRIGNNNISLNSKTIMSYLIHSIKSCYLSGETNSRRYEKCFARWCFVMDNMACKTKSDWEIVWNLGELLCWVPQVHSNPSIILIRFHDTDDSWNVVTFNYGFLAYRPYIHIFHLCRHIIYVGGCILRVYTKEKCLLVLPNMPKIIYYQSLLQLWMKRLHTIGVVFLSL